jgi:GTP cyclohydrolase I
MQIDNKKVEEAIRTLLQWVGDDPNRAGLKQTPARVAERYRKIFNGYRIDLKALLKKPTIPVKRQTGLVLVPNIKFFSFCEHHLLPIIGELDIAYLPSKKLAGLGTIIKIAHAFTNRLQLQENLTEQIAEAIKVYLQPKGVAISVRAKHYCVDREETASLSERLQTYNFLGVFKTDKALQNQFLSTINHLKHK